MIFPSGGSHECFRSDCQLKSLIFLSDLTSWHCWLQSLFLLAVGLGLASTAPIRAPLVYPTNRKALVMQRFIVYNFHYYSFWRFWTHFPLNYIHLFAILSCFFAQSSCLDTQMSFKWDEFSVLYTVWDTTLRLFGSNVPHVSPFERGPRLWFWVIYLGCCSLVWGLWWSRLT